MISRWLSASDTTGQRYNESIDPEGITPQLSRFLKRLRHKFANDPVVARSTPSHSAIGGILPGFEDRWALTRSGGVASTLPGQRKLVEDSFSPARNILHGVAPWGSPVKMAKIAIYCGLIVILPRLTTELRWLKKRTP